MDTNSKTINFLVDFIGANSLAVASVSALQELVQCAVKELNCIELDSEVRTFSKELVSWSAGKDLINWENRFRINHLRDIRSCFQNLSISFYKRSDFLRLKDWLDRCNNSIERQLWQYTLA